MNAYRKIIKANIEYDIMTERYGSERLDEAMELMLEVVLGKVGTEIRASMPGGRRMRRCGIGSVR